MVNCRYMIWTDWNCGREVEAEFFFNGTKIEDVTVEKRSVSEIYIYTYSFIVDQSLGDEVIGRAFTKPSESKSDQPTTPTEPAIEKINKKINPMKVSTAVKTVKYSKITKTKQTVAPIIVKKAKGKVNYKRVSGSKKLALNLIRRIEIFVHGNNA